MKAPSSSEQIALVIMTVVIVVMAVQGDRIWSILERLTQVETKVEIYHSEEHKHVTAE